MLNDLFLSFLLAIGIKILAGVASYLWPGVDRRSILIQTTLVALLTSPLINAMLER